MASERPDRQALAALLRSCCLSHMRQELQEQPLLRELLELEKPFSEHTELCANLPATNLMTETMTRTNAVYGSHWKLTSAVFDVLNPVPFGCFTAALIFDAVYADSAEVLWMKSAAWLIALGLLFAVVPRFINLARVWFRGGRPSLPGEKLAFWLYLFGVAAAIVNAFVHSRDAYGVIPEGVWLSVLTVGLIVIANVVLAVRPSGVRVES